MSDLSLHDVTKISIEKENIQDDTPIVRIKVHYRPQGIGVRGEGFISIERCFEINCFRDDETPMIPVEQIELEPS